MSQTVKVMEVQDVHTSIYKMLPPALNILAEGIVPALGYKNARLIPYVYVKFPADGIWDFDFVADEPTGLVPQVLSPISANYTWYDFPQGLKGVRIHAAYNSIERMISGSPERTVELKAAK